MAAKKPKGINKFADALRKLVTVDKAAVDRRVERDKAKRIKQRKKS